MGAYTCQYGYIHKMCRCPTPHTMVCDTPFQHTPPWHKCLVLVQRERTGTLGKHEAHPPHDWWYTSSGGGHQLYDGFVPSDPKGGYDSVEGNVKQWHCPGRQENQ